MAIVQDEHFLHIHKGNSPEWKVGANFFFGRTPNRFVGFFDGHGREITSPTGKAFSVNDVIYHLLQVVDGECEKDPELSDFYHYDLTAALRESYGALMHYLLLVREFTFEEVRMATFPELPSRHRCIWLIPDGPESLNYWWPGVGGAAAKIFRVAVTGKLHRASETHLHLRTCSLNALKEHAFRYWAGVTGQTTLGDEILFEGFVNVLEEVQHPG